MKSIDELRNHMKFMCDHGLMRMEMDTVSTHLDEIEHEMEEEYVPLPKDANGETIHIGDRVENNERVVRITLTDGSWEPSVYIDKAPCVLEEHFCCEVSHYHEPTVEDVLREFADLVREEQVERAQISDEAIAEFAERLQLREGE